MTQKSHSWAYTLKKKNKIKKKKTHAPQCSLQHYLK